VGGGEPLTARHYRFAGLRFASALPLPEWDDFTCGDADGPIDARITIGDRDAAQPGEYRFAVDGVAQYRIAGGDRIDVSIAPGAADGEVRLFLLGTALAALCVQRGVLLLHASVVRAGGRTIALCGPQQSGKSTLAAALVGRGAAFVCDDLARFGRDGCDSVVYPSTPRMKLSPQALASLDWPAERFPRVHPRAVKFHVPQVHGDPWSPVPLHAICLLEWADGAAATARLRGTAALTAFVNAATYRPRLLEPMGRLAAHWQQYAAIAAATPVYRLTRARRWDAAAGAIDAVERLTLTAAAEMP
jgi:hypothetical protein